MYVRHDNLKQWPEFSAINLVGAVLSYKGHACLTTKKKKLIALRYTTFLVTTACLQAFPLKSIVSKIPEYVQKSSFTF